jgi:hypothetical protein
MVALLDLASVNLAQKPKSAVQLLASVFGFILFGKLTNLDVSSGIQQDIVTLDITMDNALSVQVL